MIPQGLKEGMNPNSSEFWGLVRDNDQRMVEMCPLGTAFALVPAFWQSMDEEQKANVETWLAGSVNEKRYVS